MWVLLGNTLFTDKSSTRAHPSILSELCMEDNLERLTRYSWGSAKLAYLYRQLGHATRNGCDSIAGCLALLQAWIYEYFPCFLPHQGILTRDFPHAHAGLWDVGMTRKHQQHLVSFRTRLDQLGDHEVCWLPYGAFPAQQVPRTMFTGCIRYRGIIDPYMLDRVVRQLGFIQEIPGDMIRPDDAQRPLSVKSYRVSFLAQMTTLMWDRFVHDAALLGGYTRIPRGGHTCAPNYPTWFRRVSHPITTPNVEDDHGLPQRTNVDYWVGRFMVTAQRSLSEYPTLSRDTRAMLGQVIAVWDAINGLRD
ncbi:protein MAINTENANCE OF MERISTEMS-like [Chenopodium quinoa]|uniref:protein MAINTENANCE OF MERISTEMS-like n=1 Tax=Chenopodium quinoa TaxID=63459 RepID=UPI000B79A67C|nr:protein MAINTENANCE OF MERISTEMS-like [Chenopodium quinoa]